MNKIKEIFHDLNSELIEEIISVTKQVQLKKGEIFLKEGQVSNYIAFIQKGALQSFLIKDGKEITTYLAGPGKVSVSLTSYLTEKPAKENIRAMIETSLIVFQKKHINLLRNKSSDFNRFYIETLEHQIICIEESRFDLITLTSLERYNKLLKGNEMLLQQFSLKYLASTLGLSERQLSRIRAKR